MSDETYAYRTLLRAISTIPTGNGVTVDVIRDELEAAQCSSAEKGDAFRVACSDGYLTGVFMLLPWWSLDPIHAAVPSHHPAAKGRLVKLYRRTAQPVPAHVCEVVPNG